MFYYVWLTDLIKTKPPYLTAEFIQGGKKKPNWLPLAYSALNRQSQAPTIYGNCIATDTEQAVELPGHSTAGFRFVLTCELT